MTHRIRHVFAGVSAFCLIGAVIYFSSGNAPAAALIGALALAGGWALQSLLQGAIAGVVLRVEGSYGPGDTLTIEGVTGIVRYRDWRVTEIAEGEARHILPNAYLFTTPYTVTPRGQPQGDDSTPFLSRRHGEESDDDQALPGLWPFYQPLP